MKKKPKQKPKPQRQRLRVGDQVVSVCGNDRGKSGKILACNDKRVIVEGLNMRKKHVKPTQESPQGQIVEMEMSIHRSNIRPCNADGKAVKLGLRIGEGKSRELVDRDGNVYRTIRKGK